MKIIINISDQVLAAAAALLQLSSDELDLEQITNQCKGQSVEASLTLLDDNDKKAMELALSTLALMQKIKDIADKE